MFEHALAAAQAGGREEQRLVVDVEADDGRVRDVDDRLARARQPVGLLGVN
jgi:hypothetical protein